MKVLVEIPDPKRCFIVVTGILGRVHTQSIYKYPATYIIPECLFTIPTCDHPISRFLFSAPRRLPSKRIYTYTRRVQYIFAYMNVTYVTYVLTYEYNVCLYIHIYIYMYVCEHTIKHPDVRFSTSICRRRSPPEASKNPTTLHQAVTNPSQIFAEVSHEHG